MSSANSYFEGVPEEPGDAVLELMKAFRQDERPHKIDVSVGVFRDKSGRTPVLEVVKHAERHLLENQETKAYVAPEGDNHFLDLLASRVLETSLDDTWVAVQTPGGTGALRLSLELVRAAKLGARVFLGVPSWPNHAQIAAAAGCRLETYEHRSPLGLQLKRVLNEAQAGDALLLQACGHNPTGLDLSDAHWRLVGESAQLKGFLPIVDLAYQGLADGLVQDFSGVRILLHHCDQIAIAYSCDKNFGLYRDRVGALFVRTRSNADARLVRSNLLSQGRTSWSMPPDHGAAVVRNIFESDQMTRAWTAELAAMCARIKAVRTRLAESDPLFESLMHEKGMFSMLPVSPDDVRALREQHAIYVSLSGRVNVAGLGDHQIDRFSSAWRSIVSR